VAKVKRRPARESPDRVLKTMRKAIQVLTWRFDHIETLARGNRRVLDLQFKRMSQMQAELDQLLARLRRTG
jgi:hypothetical protein